MQIACSGQNVNDSGCSFFEQGADPARGQFAFACPFFIGVLKIWASFAAKFSTVPVRRPNDNCKLFYIRQKNWNSICVLDCAKVKCRLSCQLLTLICATMKKRICSKKLYEWDLAWAFKNGPANTFYSKVQPFYDIWQAEKSKAGSDKR